MQPIVMFKGRFQYEVINVFVDALAEAFAARGRRLVVVDGNDHEQVRAAFAQPVYGAFGFNGVGINPLPEYEHLYRDRAIPYVSLLIDHPAYNLDRIRHEPFPCLCVDHSHVRFLKTTMGDEFVADFLAHGASVATTPAAERDIDILFPAGAGSLEVIQQGMLNTYGERLTPILIGCAERLLETPDVPLADVIGAVLLRLGVDDDEQLHRQTIPAFAIYVDQYARTKRRQTWLHELDQLGLAVDIWGSGWHVQGFKHHRVHGETSYSQILALMSRAKITLNIGPMFPEGSHERVLSAMANGSAVVTDASRYWRETFNQTELVTFKGNSVMDAANHLISLLQDHERRQAVATAGQAKVLAGHLWQHRADRILTELDRVAVSLQRP